jgi:hypothetical protein
MNIKWWKLIAWLEILGGALGLVFFLAGILKGTVVPLGLLLLIGALVFFSLNVIAGVLLLRNNSIGQVLSILVQAIQIPHLTISTFILRILAGVNIIVGTGVLPTTGKPGAHFSPGVYWTFTVSPISNGQFFFGINILSLLALIYLVRFSFENPVRLQEDKPLDTKST